MISCRKYLDTVYKMFFKSNDECFVGTKREFRYNLQIILDSYIDSNFLERTLYIFRELKLIKREVTSDIKVYVTMGEVSFSETKSVYPGIKINTHMLEDRLNRAEKIIKDDFSKNVTPLLSYEELEYIKSFQEEKRNLCSNIMGKVIHEYFFSVYDKDYGFWIHDLNREKYTKDLSKLKTYTKDYFKLKKLKEDDKKINTKSLKYFYSEVMEKLLNILIKRININGSIEVSISNINSSMFLESKINKISYDKETSTLSFYSLEDFYCKITINEVNINKENTITLKDGINTVKILKILTEEEKRELDYMAEIYETMNTNIVV